VREDEHEAGFKDHVFVHVLVLAGQNHYGLFTGDAAAHVVFVVAAVRLSRLQRGQA